MLLVDTNTQVAAAETSTPEHERCAAVLDGHDDLDRMHVLPCRVQEQHVGGLSQRIAEAIDVEVDDLHTFLTHRTFYGAAARL